MKIVAPLCVVDIIGEVVAATSVVLFPTLNKNIVYQYGRSIQILKELIQLNNGITTKNKKYPLFALFQDFPEINAGNAYAFTVKFPKILIATLTQSTDPVPKRYDETFKPILYPIYEEFKRQLVRHKNIVMNDPDAIPHIKWDRPGSLPAADKKEPGNFNDYVDAIEIQNMELTFKRVNNCKPTLIN